MTDLISTKKAMEILGVGATTIKRWADEKRLPFIRTSGGHRRFKRSIVEGLLREESAAFKNDDAVEQWLRFLMEADIDIVTAEIQKLRLQHSDWFEVADFLGEVVRRIGDCWADGNYCVVEEHISSGKLEQALAATAVSMGVPASEPTALLATMSGERHALGLSLTQLCLRAVGVHTVWIGTDLPTEQLTAYIDRSGAQMVALSASVWRSDRASLMSFYQAVSSACEKHSIELIIGGRGAWPSEITYGSRCNDFSDLKKVLKQMDLVAA